MKITYLPYTRKMNYNSKPYASYNRTDLHDKLELSFKGSSIVKNSPTVEHEDNWMLKTRFFRDSKDGVLFWSFFADYLDNKFDGGTDIIQGASNVGYETLSLAMILHHKLGKRAEKFKIHPSDPDNTSVSLANSGMVCLSSKDRDLSWSKYYGINTDEYLMPCNDSKLKRKKLNQYFELMKDGDVANISQLENGNILQVFKSKSGDQKRVLDKVFLINPILKPIIGKYKSAYIQDELKNRVTNKKPCVVMLRNIFYAFKREEQYNLAKQIYDSIPKGSALVIGSCEYSLDKDKNNNPIVPQVLIEAGFKSVKSSHPAAKYIFEK